jgi:hypothetical protein
MAAVKTAPSPSAERAKMSATPGLRRGATSVYSAISSARSAAPNAELIRHPLPDAIPRLGLWRRVFGLVGGYFVEAWQSLGAQRFVKSLTRGLPRAEHEPGKALAQDRAKPRWSGLLGSPPSYCHHEPNRDRIHLGHYLLGVPDRPFRVSTNPAQLIHERRISRR